MVHDTHQLANAAMNTLWCVQFIHPSSGRCRCSSVRCDPRVYAAQNDPPPILEGMVINAAENAKGSVDLVEISLGSDDGLVKGHKLFVFRSGLQSDEDAKYLGQIELVFVDSDHAVGTVIEKAKSGIIKKGDNVTSKL